MSLPSHATPLMSAVGEYVLGSSTLGGAGTTTVRDPATGVSSGSVNIIPYVSDASGNSVFFHVYGYTGGGAEVFGSRSSGEGIFAAQGTFHLEDTIINNTGSAQDYYLNYAIAAGEIAVNCSPVDSGNSNCIGNASYDLAISFGGASVESGTGSIAIDSSGTSFTTTGLDLGGSTAGIGTGSTSASYAWSDVTRTVFLGTLADGASALLDYDLVTAAFGDYGNDGSNGCYGVGGGQATLAAIAPGGGTSACPDGTSVARSGDPFNVSGPSVFNASNNIVPTQPSGPAGNGVGVPEPQTLGLAVAGIAAASAFARRRRRHPAA